MAHDLTFSYPGRPVFRALSVSAQPGSTLAVVGENGTGKSTLLRLFAGELAPSAGSATIVGRFSYLPQEMPVHASTTVADLTEMALNEVKETASQLDQLATDFDHNSKNLTELEQIMTRIEHLEAWRATQRLKVSLTQLNAVFDPSRKLVTLSTGEQHRLGLACVLSGRPDILLLDEPTNHLDDEGIAFLTRTIASWRGICVVVTHDRELIDDVATAIVDLDPSMNGNPTVHGQPGYLTYRFAKEQARHRWQQRYRSQRAAAAKLAQQLDRSYEGLSDEWRPPKGSQKHRRGTRARIHVKAADRRMLHCETHAVEIPPPPLTLRFPDLPTAEPGWDLSEPLVELRYPRIAADHGDRLSLPGIRIDIPPAGRLLIDGPNGSGKSTLLAALAGLPLTHGYYAARPGLRIAVVAQESARVDRQSRDTGFDRAARAVLDLLAAGKLDPQQLIPIAALGLLSESDLDRPVAELSVGQRRRLDIAVGLVAMPHLLIIDEPTNHLTPDLMDELTRAFITTGAAVVIATHDRRVRADLSHWPRQTLVKRH